MPSTLLVTEKSRKKKQPEIIPLSFKAYIICWEN